MRRDPSALESEIFDLLVIGGGIYGAWIACDAAQRGLSVALIEKNDWGSGTSMASSKLIHGGLRYLEHGWFSLVRRTLEERERLLRIAPGRVWRRPFLMPVFGDTRWSAWKIRAGLWVYDAMAGGFGGEVRHRRLSKEQAQQLFPALGSSDLLSCYEYHDAQTDDARLTLEIVAGALDAGAVAVNRVRARSLLTTGARVVGAAVRDELGGKEFELRARLTVNATGPWTEGLCPKGRGAGRGQRIRTTRGVHLVMPGLATAHAALLTARRDGRVYFMLPWYGRTLLGTTDDDDRSDPDEVSVQAGDREYLLEEANSVLGKGMWSPEDILGETVGLRTLVDESGGSGKVKPSAVNREWMLDESRDGMLRPLGGKLTSARIEAALTLDRALALLEKPHIPSLTDKKLLIWCHRDANELQGDRETGRSLGLDPEVVEHLLRRFGRRSRDIFAAIQKDSTLSRRLEPELPFIAAELVHAAKEEMAMDLDDVLRRRVPLLLLSRHKREILKDTLELLSPLWGWGEAQGQSELEEVLRKYASTFVKKA